MRPIARFRPIFLGVMCILALAVGLRSIWCSYTLSWNTLEESGGSVMLAELGVQIAQLGIRFFHLEKLSPLRTGRARLTPQVIPGEAGVKLTSEALKPEPGVVRWFGLGLQHEVDERPETFKNVSSITLPLWLIAALLAINPVKGIKRRLRETIANAGSPIHQSGGVMRIVIALIIGLILGSIGTWFIARPMGAQPQGAMANPVALVEEPAIHPIVGSWRIRMAPIVATYVFKNDKTFLLTFKGVPGPRNAPLEHHAEGSWAVQGSDLRMRNTASSSDYSVVGENEDAKIVSVSETSLVLEHADSKGKPERLELERVRPFVKGKFDNPALIGEWRSEQYSLQLKDSGEAIFGVTTGNAIASGSWSQSAGELRMMLVRSKPQPPVPASPRTARRAPTPPIVAPAEPSEMIYEILNARERNMLLLRSTLPNNGERLTFYRVN